MSKTTSRKTVYDPATGEALRIIETVEIDGVCVEETITDYEPESKPAKKPTSKKSGWSAERRAKYNETLAGKKGA